MLSQPSPASPTFLREGEAGRSSVRVGDKAGVDADVLLLETIENSFGSAEKHSVGVRDQPDGCPVSQTESLHLTCSLWSRQPGGTSLLCPRSSWTTQTWSRGSSHGIRSSERRRPHRRRPQLSPSCLGAAERW